jgi:hypothetical protein
MWAVARRNCSDLFVFIYVIVLQPVSQRIDLFEIAFVSSDGPCGRFAGGRLMSQSGMSDVELYDYGKLNTNSLFRRLVTDIEGQHLHDLFLDEPEDEPAEKTWRWIQT